MQTLLRSDDVNVVSAVLSTARSRGMGACATVKRGGRWETHSWKEVSERILATAAGLKRLGLRKGDRVAILGATRLEWTVADCAILALGGITVPLYGSLTPEGVGSILRDSAPSLAVLENARSVKLFEEAMQRNGASPIPIVGMDEGVGACQLEAIAAQSTPDERRDVERGLGNVTLDDPATFVYTSGTTGEYKGVVISHRMLLSEVRAVQGVHHFSPDEVNLLFLPLAHVLGRLVQFFQLVDGFQTAYAESFERLAHNYREVRPHVAFGVPRVLEKVQEKFSQTLAAASPAARRIGSWALRVGEERSKLVQKQRPIPARLVVQYAIADLLVFRKLRRRLGGRLRLFVCGGGKLQEAVGRFFHAAGILVLEGYGLTETFSASTVNYPEDYHFGTVGKALPGISVKLAPDGEILLQGPTIFRAYLNRPEDTRNAFDDAGWFRTGDLGEFSRDGFLRITGRKKDLIVTSGGKNIAPQVIETLMADSPFIDHVMVYGEGRKYLTALVTLNEPAVRRHLRELGQEDAVNGDLARHELVKDLIGRHIEEQNRKLAKFETIKRFAILDADFSIETGELTPTLKVRREFTSAKYSHILDSLYRE